MRFKQGAALVLTLSLALCLPVSTRGKEPDAAESKDVEVTFRSIADTRTAENGYRSYINLYGDAPVAAEEIAVAADRANEESVGVQPAPTDGGQREGLAFLTGARAVFDITIPHAGLYSIRIEYSYVDMENLKNSDLAILVDGELPFYESGEQSLPRIWGQEDLVHQKGSHDFTPKSVQAPALASYTAGDQAGIDGTYYYFMESGVRRLTFASEAGGFVVARATLGSGRAVAPQRVAHCGYNGDVQIIEAENITMKNDSSITGGVDRSDAGVSPNDPGYRRVNYVSGNKFFKPGQSITWKVRIAADGHYRIGLKYKQDAAHGMFVTRRLLVDGEPVSAAAENLRFPYANQWKHITLQDNGEALCVDLEAGEHTLTLEVTLGDIASFIGRLDDVVYTLNYLYRKTIMITGVSPDPLRDFNLKAEIPYLLPVFSELNEELLDIYDSLENLGVKGGQISVISQMAHQLKTFISNPYTIHNRLNYYKSNIGALSSLVVSLQEQPLSLDYLTLSSTEEDISYRKTDWWVNLWFHTRAFFYSFVSNYSALGNGDSAAGESIDVWFSGGREQAEILQTIADEDFSRKSGISVNLQLVAISLSQAILAGTSPDIVLSTARSQPVNLGARGVLEDLSALDGFDKLRALFGEELLAPYTNNNQVYALPVTLDYFVTFYREDILKELGLALPQTWDDVYDMIPVLQRNNMTFGFPYTLLSSQALIESGIGAKDIFATMLLQQGLPVYSSDRTTIRLDNPRVIDIFEQWTKLYTEYQLDLEYSFYNRFRTGEMPIAVHPYSSYNMLSATAPEIRGLWGISTIPGTVREDGSVDCTTAASGSGTVLMKNSRHTKSAWEFMQWWVSAEAQSAYGNGLELLLGPASRYNPANPLAMEALLWNDNELAVLKRQREQLRELPEVIGGYYTARGIDNAFRNVVLAGANYRESLIEQNDVINAELARKQREFADLP